MSKLMQCNEPLHGTTVLKEKKVGMEYPKKHTRRSDGPDCPYFIIIIIIIILERKKMFYCAEGLL